MIERDERSFEHDLRQWASDCIWALDNEKVRPLLLDIFSRRTRASNIQARMWKRVVDLYWREGRTTPEIAEQFGVGREEIRRIVKNLRREAKEFFDVYGQPTVRQKARKPTKPKAIPIAADPSNESPEHWSAVLASHGLYEPDKRVKGWRWKKPTYTFSWPVMQSADEKEAAWGFTFSWGEFFESFQASTEDPERFKGFVAHVPTMGDVDRAVDGDPEARDYLRHYGQLEARKFKIVPAIADPCEGRPFMQKLAAPKASNDVYIAEDGSVYECGSNKLCGHVDRKNISDTRSTARLFFGAAGINRISDATNVTEKDTMYSELMDYKQAAEIIKEFNIPRSVVARLSSLHLPDLSAWLGGKIDISDEKRERVSRWVADIAKMIQAMTSATLRMSDTSYRKTMTLRYK